MEIHCTTSPELSDAYRGTGSYLVAVYKDRPPVIERCLTPDDRREWVSDKSKIHAARTKAVEEFDAQVTAFRAAHKGAKRITMGFGSTTVVDVPPADRPHIGWPGRIADAFWRLLDTAPGRTTVTG